MRDLRKVKQKLWKDWKKAGKMEIYKQFREVTNNLQTRTKKARK